MILFLTFWKYSVDSPDLKMANHFSIYTIRTQVCIQDSSFLAQALHPPCCSLWLTKEVICPVAYIHLSVCLNCVDVLVNEAMWNVETDVRGHQILRSLQFAWKGQLWTSSRSITTWNHQIAHPSWKVNESLHPSKRKNTFPLANDNHIDNNQSWIEAASTWLLAMKTAEISGSLPP